MLMSLCCQVHLEILDSWLSKQLTVKTDQTGQTCKPICSFADAYVQHLFTHHGVAQFYVISLQEPPFGRLKSGRRKVMVVNTLHAGKKFSRRHFVKVFLFFLENRIFSFHANSLHEI